MSSAYKKNSMGTPTFLIIGAMKSGTTSLHSDLNAHPEIYLPENKEPEVLCKNISKEKMVSMYSKLEWMRSEESIYGEASTAYAKFPTYAGIPEIARDVLGKELKLIYMVRDPIKRAVSHHYHDFLAGRVSGDINKELFSNSNYVDYSKYSMQAEKWVEVFGKESLKIVLFEEYLNDRNRVLCDIFQFLGVPEVSIPVTEAKNVSSKKLVPGRFVRKMITDNVFYRNYIKPVLPANVKAFFSVILMRRPQKKPDALGEKEMHIIQDMLKEDTERFLTSFGLSKETWGGK